MAGYTRQQLDTIRADKNLTPATWASKVLQRLSIAETPGARAALVGWARAEGGHWNNQARYNPLNTTQPEPGAGNTGSQGNIKVYKNWDQGIEATVTTLRNGHYEVILDALKSGDSGSVADAIGKTPWGTSADLVRRTIASTPNGKTTRSTTSARGGSRKAAVSAASGKLTPGSSTAPTLTPGGEKTDTAGAVTAALLDKRKGMSLVSRMQEAISSGKYTTSTVAKVTPGKVTPAKYDVTTADGGKPTGGGSDLKARADAIDAKKLPYQWGGGHGGKVDAFNAAPLDCSGAVSAVLGINPRVASQFKSWGKAGDGGSKGVTVYAKDSHVLMKINGHFWGTSGTNPGGGAGWIKQKDISPAYLAGFTARHG